jgi:hypothetical protein
MTREKVAYREKKSRNCIRPDFLKVRVMLQQCVPLRREWGGHGLFE